jgi:DNA-binding response OmpR family regulator
MTRDLAGLRVLVVEDEALVAAMVVDILTDLGAEVVGPAYNIATGESLAAEAEIDMAILDANLGGVLAESVADILTSRGVPFLFASGYGRHAMMERFSAPTLDKPYTEDELIHGLSRLRANIATG